MTMRITLEQAFIGDSAVMRALRDTVRRLASADDTVLITGERGTGKELVAQCLHAGSRRRDRALVVVDCAALPENLVESELFGYERGAFTGASRPREGLIESAQGGTLFLDEVARLPLLAQGRLLRFLESRTVRRIGGQDVRTITLRVIAASNQDLHALAAEGRFLPDLCDRLDVLPLRTPALREHREDIPALVAAFLGPLHLQLHDVPATRLAEWQAADWPGNVRALRNAVTRWVWLERAPDENGPQNPQNALGKR